MLNKLTGEEIVADILGEVPQVPLAAGAPIGGSGRLDGWGV